MMAALVNLGGRSVSKMRSSNRSKSLGSSIPTWLCLLLLALPGGASAQTARQKKLKDKVAQILPREGWDFGTPRDALDAGSYLHYKGKNCHIRTTVSPEAARDIGKFIDVYLELFRKIFTARFIINAPLTTVVFAHKSEFDAYYESVYRTREKWTRSALYCPHKKETWIVLVDGGAKKVFPLETAKHELTHHMLHFFTGQAELPPWFNEGSACFFQYWDIASTMEENIAKNLAMARQGDFGYFPAVILEAFGSDRFIPPSRLIAMDYDAFHLKDSTLERLHYSESWALVNFLTTTKTGQKFFNQVVTSLRAGKKLEQVLAKETLASLEDAWYRDIEKRIVPALKGEVSAKSKAPPGDG
jgi:hypothetical protein